MRLRHFVHAVRRFPNIDLAVQMGDFCHPTKDAVDYVKLFNDLPCRKLHVLGNHDMDYCDKLTAMRFLGMSTRYGVYDVGDFRFIVLDLNHLKDGDKVIPYAYGNYYSTPRTSYIDQEQLDWLDRQLRVSTRPIILISHQPLGFAEPGKPLPPEQLEVLQVISAASKANPDGKVAACIFGHRHVDRLEYYEGIPCLCINSASYFWDAGMYPYTKPLYAFIKITPEGHMYVSGVEGGFAKTPPATCNRIPGLSASVTCRRLSLRAKCSAGLRSA